jgi:hypothetical protein
MHLPVIHVRVIPQDDLLRNIREAKREGTRHTSLTTSLNSSSISFSALKNLCHKSSPTEPRCNNDVRACFEFRIWTIRRISSVARRRSAALMTVSGTAGDFSSPSSGESMWRRER